MQNICGKYKIQLSDTEGVAQLYLVEISSTAPLLYSCYGDRKCEYTFGHKTSRRKLLNKVLRPLFDSWHKWRRSFISYETNKVKAVLGTILLLLYLLRGQESNLCPEVMSLVSYLYSTPLCYVVWFFNEYHQPRRLCLFNKQLYLNS